jgi:lysozyme
MTIFGVDVHAQYQAGLNIEQVRAEGFDFIAVKLSEGRGTFGGLDWIRRGQACGLLCLGYHYLRSGDEVGQAAVFSQQLAAAGGIPGMLDAEAVTAVGQTPTLTVSGIHRFLDACAANGARVPLLYLPRWYWQRMGSPDLSGLPMLWASSYVAGSDYASVLYENVTPRSWAAYGGLPVAVLQFTDRALVAGQRVDADAYLGTRDDFVKLIGSNTPPSPVPPPAPLGPSSIPQVEYGQTNDTVLRLQAFMNEKYRSYSHLPVTGFYGDLTVQVVKEFQRRVGIVGADGRNCGPLTIAKLWEAGFRG